jgi:hypothetical protein
MPFWPVLNCHGKFNLFFEQLLIGKLIAMSSQESVGRFNLE